MRKRILKKITLLVVLMVKIYQALFTYFIKYYMFCLDIILKRIFIYNIVSTVNTFQNYVYKFFGLKGKDTWY